MRAVCDATTCASRPSAKIAAELGASYSSSIVWVEPTNMSTAAVRLMSVSTAEAVIKEARRRQFRRRLAIAAAALAAAGVGFALYLELGGGAGISPSGVGPVPAATSPLRLPRVPYLGLACPSGAAYHPCERMGLAVWLRRPARSVTAVVHGHAVRLATAAGGTGSYRRSLFWQGFFSDPYVADLASGGGTLLVRIRVLTPGGSVLTGRAIVYVSAGYG